MALFTGPHFPALTTEQRKEKIAEIKLSAPSLGKKWTAQEDNRLKELLAAGNSIHTIATKHGRTHAGIRCRIKLLAYHMHTENIPIDQIIQTLRITPTKYEESIQQMDTKKQKTEQRREERSLKKQKQSTIEIAFQAADPIVTDDHHRITEIERDLKEIKQDIKRILAILESIQ